MFNAASWFVDRNVDEGRGASPALHCDGRTLTYADVQELRRPHRATPSPLSASGAEDRVLLLCHDAPEFLGAFWGAIKIGAVPVPVNTFLKPEEWLYCLEDSGARVVVVSAPLVEAGGGPVRVGRAAPARARRGRTGGPVPVLRGALRASERRTSRPLRPRATIPPSGSTRPDRRERPRRPSISSTTCWSAARRSRGTSWRSDPRDVVFSAAKLFFAYGLGARRLLPGQRGRAVRPAPARHDAGPRLRGPGRATGRRCSSPGPALYAAMLAAKDAPRARRSRFAPSVRLRGRVPARRHLPPLEGPLRRRDHRRHRHHRSASTCSSRTGRGRCRPGSSGQPVPGYEAAIVDERGAPVARGEIGNLRIKGDSIMAGYWNQPEKTQVHARRRLDRDGRQVLPGRRRLLLALRPQRRHDEGQAGPGSRRWRWSPRSSSMPAVLQAAVVGHKDAEGLIKAKAYRRAQGPVPRRRTPWPRS